MITILKRDGITKEGLLLSASDMTASALLGGKLNVGCKGSGTCGMHKCELITQHATGQAMKGERSCGFIPYNGKVQGKDEEVCDIYYGHEAEIKIQTI